ncbi:putative alpha-amylase [Planoprotostelium fungivorum]|uniref:Alpha-amylase n=1 Tax=Planoprotostelium fungivorum TaxID=1890364 RepID=A0A2P6NZP3_9EUKA|nr:putative alpha-amylase [Planoprotostelium fungivorum]
MKVLLLLVTLAVFTSAQKDTIVQLFEWNWDSIGRECIKVLGPLGYGYAQETIQGAAWWTSYQPVSYTVNNKRGSRDQFKKMVADCNGAGVKILVDAVMNHMTGGSGTGVDGHGFTHYSYPGTYSNLDFHYCGSNGNNINNYKNKTEVWTCQLSGLADLATDTSYVQGRLSSYLADLMSMGVAGFRLDAAKHMDPQNIKAIVGKLTTSPFLTQEVIYGYGEGVQPYMYTDIGNVMVFQGSRDLKRMFESDGIANLVRGNGWGQSWGNGYLPSDKANVFVVDHDTERDGSTISYKSNNNAFNLAHVFLLAYDYSTPTVYSGYNFDDFNAGPPGGDHVQDVQCGNGWRCDHRQIPIANMVAFHNAVQGTPISNVVTMGDQALAFGRGEKGFVIINNQDQPWKAQFKTSLPAGTYCDVVHSKNPSNKACSGPTYVVDGSGLFTAAINSRDALAIYEQSASPAPPTTETEEPTTSTTSTDTTVPTTTGTHDDLVEVNFKLVKEDTAEGQTVYITGDSPAVGNWDVNHSPALQNNGSNVWVLSARFKPGRILQYKYFTRYASGGLDWEKRSNRLLKMPSSGSIDEEDQYVN